LILGAAGRDFHNFNVYFRGKERYNVVGFTGAQIPGIADKKYPPELAGNLYPEGISVYAEEALPRLIKELNVDFCVFSYSDISYQHVMGLGTIINAAGSNYMMLSPKVAMLKSKKLVIAVCAVRTGADKSQSSRRIIELLMERGLRVIAIRHPMPYGDLDAQRVQRFAKLEDLEKHKCTIEETEEYGPHVVSGNVVYAGVGYQDILTAAEEDPKGCDVIVWNGGNNDFPFYNTDLMITVAARQHGARELIDPGPYTVGSISETLKNYPYIGTLLPAMGYGKHQLKDLETTVNKVDCDAVVIGTPINLSRIIDIKKPNARASYELREIGMPKLGDILSKFVKMHDLPVKK